MGVFQELVLEHYEGKQPTVRTPWEPLDPMDE